MFKQSIYNVFIGKYYENDVLYNSCSGALSEFDADSLKFMENIETYMEDTATEEEKALKKLMYENGFIVDKEDDELNWVLMQNRGIRYDFHSSKVRFVIAPTMLCNFKCYYCFESKANKMRKMSEEIINKLIEFIRGQMHEGLKELYISWFGGEPLVALDVIENISQRIVNICREKNIVYQSDILTNGSLLDYKTAQKLHDDCCVTSVQIPIDGMAKTYSIRKGVSENIFYQVIDNICDICEMMEVHIRMNVDQKNRKEILELARYLLMERDLKDKIRIYVAPIKNYSNICSFTDSSCFSSDELFEFKMEFANLLKELGEKVSLLISSIRKPSYMSCGLSRVNNLVIDPNGDFYRCAHLIGHKENTIGNVSIGQVFNDENMRFLNMEFQGKCKKCNLFPICMGGCYFERMLNNDNSSCRERLERLRHNLMISYEYL